MSLAAIFDKVHTDPDLVNNSWVSSEKTLYPVTNLYDLNQRRKVWRSDGYWLVESGSNTIVFQESVGVDLTATISAGEYTTTALFLAAIKTALEAVGAATYTVVQDTTTGRIKITSNLGGGATVFRLRWTQAAAFGQQIGFEATADQTGADNYMAENLKIHSFEALEWDLGIPTNPTFFCAIGDRNAPLKISPNAVVKLQAAHTRSWTTPPLSLTLTYRTGILAAWDEDGLAGSGFGGYRFWRLLIEDEANPNLYVELGCAGLFTHSPITRGCPTFPFEPGMVSRDLVDESEDGAEFSAPRAQSQEIPLNWAGLDTATKEGLDSIWEQMGRHTAFMVFLDPDNVLSSDGLGKMVKLVKFLDPPAPRRSNAAQWEYAWRLREQV